MAITRHYDTVPYTLMNTWWSLALGDGMMAVAVCEELREKFAAARAHTHAPANMAIFKRHDLEHSLHCDVTAYFSPDAAQLAQTVGAVRCAAPLRAGLELVAGDATVWNSLFESGKPSPD